LTRGLPGVVLWWRATSTGPPVPTCTITTCSPCRRTHTVCPARWWGTEYWPCSKQIIGVFSATVRVTPNVAVNGTSGNRCNRACSWASISTGARRVTRCGRALISVVNTAQAVSNSAKLP
jgi:epoxyqueuosine reductase QueG